MYFECLQPKVETNQTIFRTRQCNGAGSQKFLEFTLETFFDEILIYKGSLTSNLPIDLKFWYITEKNLISIYVICF